MKEAQRRASKERRRISGRIKKRILKRDDFSCRTCGSKNNLTIHHIVPLADFFKKNKNEKDLGEVRNDENLLTLCESCHEKVHKR